MVQLTPQSRIWLALAPVDFRKGIDGLAAVCRQTVAQNPLDGAIYVFRNRTGTTLKRLCYDGQGYCYVPSASRRGACGGGRGRTAPRCAWWPASCRCCSGTAAPTGPPWRPTGARWLKPAPDCPGSSTAATPPAGGTRHDDGFAGRPNTPAH